MKIGDRVMFVGRSIEEDRFGLIIDTTDQDYIVLIGDEKVEAAIAELYLYGTSPDEESIQLTRWVKCETHKYFSTDGSHRIRF